MRCSGVMLLAVALFTSARAQASAQVERVSVGGYLRVMTRPDFQGGDGRLGHWNLYGRLLNEGPWAALDLRVDLLQATSPDAPWSAAHLKLEGGALRWADPSDGSLAGFRLTQLYVETGNVALDHVTWRVGSLEHYFGDLGLYDLRPSQVLNDTLGASASYRDAWLDLVVGVGDAGWALRDQGYNTVLTGAIAARVRMGEHVELGAGGQGYFEPAVPGHRYAPYATPGIDYEDYWRREVGLRLEQSLPPDQASGALLPKPDPIDATSSRAVAYLGVGKLGPLRWLGVHALWLKKHPKDFVVDTSGSRARTVYVAALTDERTGWTLGQETALVVWPRLLDLELAALVGGDDDADNDVAPSEENRRYTSVVARAQAYLTNAVHLLAEASLAREHSTQGNLWRAEHDSIFASDDGLADSRGLEYGDLDTRETLQLKGGLVFNPAGQGIFTRPSLRLLWGSQRSNVHAAFGNSFSTSLAERDELAETKTRRWHHLIALEAETWF